MTPRRDALLLLSLACLGLGLGFVSVGVGVGRAIVVASLIVVYVDYVVSVVVKARAGGRGSRGRWTRSSGWSGGLGWLRASRGGMRRLLSACTSVERLVDYLLDRAVGKLPEVSRARFAEEWQDHRTHFSGWRLVWWALCVRALAMRTAAALGPSRLPRDS